MRNQTIAGISRGLALMMALALAGCSPATDDNAAAVNAGHTSGGIRLSPSPAYAASRITAEFEDKWLSPERVRYVWLRNRSPIPEATSNVLEPQFFSRNDVITVEATFDDPATGGTRTLHGRVNVVNTAPRVSNVVLATAGADVGAGVQAVVEAMDPDGDALNYVYRWFRNGAAIDGAANAALTLGDATPSDRIEVEVVADDGEARSPAVRSAPFVLQNRPPRFTSQPVAPKPGEDIYRYLATADDPDGDALRFELVAGPDGMRVDPGGELSWRMASGRGNDPSPTVQIRVSDPKGGIAVQTFQLDVRSAKQASR